MGCLMTNAVPVDAVLLSVLPAYLLSPIYSIPRYVYVCTVAHYHTSCGLWESQGLDITLNCWGVDENEIIRIYTKTERGARFH